MSPTSLANPESLFPAGLNRLETHRQFVSKLLEQVPPLREHACVTQVAGHDASHTPAQLAQRVVDSAWLIDGISRPARDRIRLLIRALPDCYPLLGADERAQLDQLLDAGVKTLRRHERGMCCLTHKRTSDISQAILAFRRSAASLTASPLSDPLPPAGSSPILTPPPSPPSLKPASLQAGDDSDPEWEIVDKPRIDAGDSEAAVLKANIERLSDEFNLVNEHIIDCERERLMSPMASRSGTSSPGGHGAQFARQALIKASLEADIQKKHALNVALRNERQALFTHTHADLSKQAVSVMSTHAGAKQRARASFCLPGQRMQRLESLPARERKGHVQHP